MTSIDIYQQLVQDVPLEELASERKSTRTEHQQRDQFQQLLVKSREVIQVIKEINGDILRLKDRLMTVTDSNKEAQICAQIKKKCDQNYLLINQLREQLTKSGAIVEQLKEENPDQPQTYSKIFRRKHLAQEVDRIIGQTFSIQKLVEKYSIQTNLKRIRLVLPEATQQDVRKLANQSGGFQQAVKRKVTSQVSKKWVYTANDILSKNQGIKALEVAVEENLRLIKEVLALVQQQGEMIDNILANVTKAKDYVVKAEKILEKEKESHKTSRKKICCIIFIALTVLALIATPIILKVVNSKKAN